MSSFKTPPRQRRAPTPHRTPNFAASPSRIGNRAYSSATPRSEKKKTPGDRFIPNLTEGDMDFARYKVACRDFRKDENATSPTNSRSPSQKEASAAMREKLLSLKGKSSEDRILSFKQINSISSSNLRTPGECRWECRVIDYCLCCLLTPFQMTTGVPIYLHASRPAARKPENYLKHQKKFSTLQVSSMTTVSDKQGVNNQLFLSAFLIQS